MSTNQSINFQTSINESTNSLKKLSTQIDSLSEIMPRMRYSSHRLYINMWLNNTGIKKKDSYRTCIVRWLDFSVPRGIIWKPSMDQYLLFKRRRYLGE